VKVSPSTAAKLEFNILELRQELEYGGRRELVQVSRVDLEVAAHEEQEPVSQPERVRHTSQKYAAGTKNTPNLADDDLR